VESWAGIAALEEAQRARAIAERRFEEDEKTEKSRRSTVVIEKIRPPNCQIDQDSARETTSGSQTGQWILRHKKLQDWMNYQSTEDPLLWLNGIPGAGKLSFPTLVAVNLTFTRENNIGFVHYRGGRKTARYISSIFLLQTQRSREEHIH
jgi:hypothetical protein